MFEIIEKRRLSKDINLFRIRAPEIAAAHLPGQFVVLRIHEEGERVPVTVADVDRREGSITLIVQELGKTTVHLGTLESGTSILDIAGPLGTPTAIRKYGTVVSMSGGVGTAEAYPIIKALKGCGNRVISIIGARSKGLLILEEEMKQVSDHFLTSTDDGSCGRKGIVTDILKSFLEKDEKIDLVLCVGPVRMMQAVAAMTKGPGIKTLVSLNPIMVDGTGLCGSCRLTIDGKARFVCVDGPEFDAHLVDFDELIKRQRMYLPQEKESLGCFHKKTGVRKAL
jgi:ferredoxin--NADP+ reductase